MKRHFVSRFLALFLTLAVGLCLPVPAHALRGLNTVENAGLEEDLASHLRAGQPQTAATTAGLEEESRELAPSLLEQLLRQLVEQMGIPRAELMEMTLTEVTRQPAFLQSWQVAERPDEESAAGLEELEEMESFPSLDIRDGEMQTHPLDSGRPWDQSQELSQQQAQGITGFIRGMMAQGGVKKGSDMERFLGSLVADAPAETGVQRIQKVFRHDPVRVLRALGSATTRADGSFGIAVASELMEAAVQAAGGSQPETDDRVQRFAEVLLHEAGHVIDRTKGRLVSVFAKIDARPELRPYEKEAAKGHVSEMSAFAESAEHMGGAYFGKGLSGAVVLRYGTEPAKATILSTWAYPLAPGPDEVQGIRSGEQLQSSPHQAFLNSVGAALDAPASLRAAGLEKESRESAPSPLEQLLRQLVEQMGIPRAELMEMTLTEVTRQPAFLQSWQVAERPDEESTAGLEENQFFRENLLAGRRIESFGWDFLEDVVPGKSRAVLELLRDRNIVVPSQEESPNPLRFPLAFSGRSQTQWHNPYSRPERLGLEGQVVQGPDGPEILTAQEEAAVHRRLADVTLLNDLLIGGGDASIHGLARAFGYEGDEAALTLIRLGREAVPELFSALLEAPMDSRSNVICQVLAKIVARDPDPKMAALFHDQAVQFVRATDEWDRSNLKTEKHGVRNVRASRMEGGMRLLAFIEPRPEAVDLLAGISGRYDRADGYVFNWMGANAGRMGAEAKAKASAWLGKTHEEYRAMGAPAASFGGGRVLLREDSLVFTHIMDALRAVDPAAAAGLVQPTPNLTNEAVRMFFNPADGLGNNYGPQLRDYIDGLDSSRLDLPLNTETVYPAVADTLVLLNRLLEQDETGSIPAGYNDDLAELRFRILLGSISFHEGDSFRPGELQPLDPLYALQSVIKTLLRGDHPEINLGTLRDRPEGIPALLSGETFKILAETIRIRNEARPAFTRQTMQEASTNLEALAQVPSIHLDETLADLAERLRGAGISEEQMGEALAAFTWMNRAANYDTTYSTRVDAWFDRYRQREFPGVPPEVADDIRLAIASVYYEPSFVARDFDLTGIVGKRLTNHLKTAGLEEGFTSQEAANTLRSIFARRAGVIHDLLLRNDRPFPEDPDAAFDQFPREKVSGELLDQRLPALSERGDGRVALLVVPSKSNAYLGIQVVPDDRRLSQLFSKGMDSRSASQTVRQLSVSYPDLLGGVRIGEENIGPEVLSRASLDAIGSRIGAIDAGEGVLVQLVSPAGELSVRVVPVVPLSGVGRMNLSLSGGESPFLPPGAAPLPLDPVGFARALQRSSPDGQSSDTAGLEEDEGVTRAKQALGVTAANLRAAELATPYNQALVDQRSREARAAQDGLAQAQEEVVERFFALPSAAPLGPEAGQTTPRNFPGYRFAGYSGDLDDPETVRVYLPETPPAPLGPEMGAVVALAGRAVDPGRSLSEVLSTYQDRLSISQLEELTAWVQGRDRAVTVTAVTGDMNFFLYADSGLAGVANQMTSDPAEQVEGINFVVSDRLRELSPDQFETPALALEDAGAEGPFDLSALGGRVRGERISAEQMRGLKPVSWVALSFNPELQMEHVLDQGVLALTIKDDKGTTVLLFA